jgi:cell division protein FtsZ
LEDTDKIIEVLEGSDMVFVTTGLGGGTGTGGAPIVASLATELGALTVAVVTKPFLFEGRRRLQQAEQGLRELHESVDTVITIPNERLFAAVTQTASIGEAFKAADDVLRQAVQGISDLITVPGFINLDFAAISSPLLEEASIKGAKGVLINITGGPDLTLYEVNEAATIVRQEADEDANIIFGHVIDETMADAMKITVIATGFNRQPMTAAVGAGASMPVTAAPRYDVPSPDFGVTPGSKPRSEDLDVPTFIRKKAD